jgi:hypothetical protein
VWRRILAIATAGPALSGSALAAQGSFSPVGQQADAGADKISVTGPALVPGRYAITMTPSLAGREGEPKTTTITITG